ncbi:hypothetical protein BDM02DRAFT_578881 [Thelephora ganbajun]|uniref:Uncharacterized protein n=1 Tax=Thelephora ganbajun TaxID=370292 RepID=A0ACB6Z8E3_THEGA|nr:hypothetical protein BDM02DRAFT_578881 [Thelephora ganbajun]
MDYRHGMLQFWIITEPSHARPTANTVASTASRTTEKIYKTRKRATGDLVSFLQNPHDILRSPECRYSRGSFRMRHQLPCCLSELKEFPDGSLKKFRTLRVHPSAICFPLGLPVFGGSGGLLCAVGRSVISKGYGKVNRRIRVGKRRRTRLWHRHTTRKRCTYHATRVTEGEPEP